MVCIKKKKSNLSYWDRFPLNSHPVTYWNEFGRYVIAIVEDNNELLKKLFKWRGYSKARELTVNDLKYIRDTYGQNGLINARLVYGIEYESDNCYILPYCLNCGERHRLKEVRRNEQDIRGLKYTRLTLMVYCKQCGKERLLEETRKDLKWMQQAK